ERRKLALSIHDSLSQTLSVVKLKLISLCGEAEGKPPVARDLADLLQLVDQLIQQTRTLTFDLYPAMLDDLGLVPTLKWYRTQYQEQTGIKVEIAEFGQVVTLPTPVVNYLFRAVKEVVLSVYWQRQRVRVVVVDDGCGVGRSPKDNGSPAGGGLGLVGIRERIHSFGGEFVFESWPGRGTQVTLEVPIESR